jgi:hypothetical protein
MTVVALDTYAVVKELMAAGFTDMQAEVVTRILRRSQNVDLSELATKTDLQVGLAALRGERQAGLAAAKIDLAETKAGLEKSLAETKAGQGRAREKPRRNQGGHTEMDAWRNRHADCCDHGGRARPGEIDIALEHYQPDWNRRMWADSSGLIQMLCKQLARAARRTPTIFQSG